MKDKLVIWGENEKDEKVMMGIHLLSDLNKIEIYLFPDALVTETFEKAMMNDWRNGQEVVFPEGHTKLERDLSMGEPLLPDNLKTKEADLINRAKTEWHFVVLSQKLSQEFKHELDELKEKIEGLKEYDSAHWNELKGYWSKVQKQMREKTLIWQHTKELKDVTNGLFDKLKSLRTQFEGELQEKSVTYKAEFSSALDDIQTKINNDARLKPLFEDLKNLQKKFWDTKFISKHRNELKKQFDKAFQEIKTKRFGGNSSEESPVARLEKRLNGLDNAIHRMESSIKRDVNELEFQQRRIDTTDGQLEAQMRQAKIDVVKVRVESKNHKLEDMLKTKLELESRLVSAKDRLAKQQAEAQRKAEIAKAKKEAKEKIAAEIKEKETSVSPEEAEKLAKAAQELAKKGDVPVAIASETSVEVEKPKDTVEPEKPTDVEEVEKPKDTVEPEKPKDTVEVEKPTESEVTDVQSKVEGVIDSVVGVVGPVIDDIVDSVKAVAEILEEKVEDIVEDWGNDDGDDKKS